MTRRLALATVLLGGLGFVLGPKALHAATCTGSTPCNACKSCSSCAHCAKLGGTCGVCTKKTDHRS